MNYLRSCGIGFVLVVALIFTASSNAKSALTVPGCKGLASLSTMNAWELENLQRLYLGKLVTEMTTDELDTLLSSVGRCIVETEAADPQSEFESQLRDNNLASLEKTKRHLETLKGSIGASSSGANEKNATRLQSIITNLDLNSDNLRTPIYIVARLGDPFGKWLELGEFIKQVSNHDAFEAIERRNLSGVSDIGLGIQSRDQSLLNVFLRLEEGKFYVSYFGEDDVADPVITPMEQLGAGLTLIFITN